MYLPLPISIAFVTVPKHKIIRREENTSAHCSVFQRTLLKCHNANCSDIIGRMYIDPEDDITSHITDASQQRR